MKSFRTFGPVADDGACGALSTSVRKTAPDSRIPPYYEFATDTPPNSSSAGEGAGRTQPGTAARRCTLDLHRER